MSILETVFNLTKEEQIALLQQMEGISAVSTIEIINSDDYEDESIDIAQELSNIKQELFAEVQNITITAQQGIQGVAGKDGRNGIDGKDGKNGRDGKDGKDGIDGEAGVSVVDAEVGFDNRLSLELSNGEVIDAGQINVQDGMSGTYMASKVFPTDAEFNSITFNEAGTTNPVVPGMAVWNSTDDCLDINQFDGSTLQVGQEQYVQVRNGTTGTLTEGTVVGFTGVNGGNIPLCGPFVAGITSLPLYFIGVLTNDIVPNALGKATLLGKVRSLNTTGSSVSESWAIGDLLWSHPTMAGKLTKVQPTAPYPAISVAAVLKVDANDGIILVRPTIFPRLWFGVFSDTTNQTAASANTAYGIKFNTTDIAAGFSIDSLDTTKIIANTTGLYNFQFSIQFTSTNSSRAKIWIWYRKNGVDVPHSATVLTIDSNNGKLAPAWNFVVSLQATEYFQLYWATDSTSVSLSAEAATAFAPSVPSALITVTQVNL